MRLLLALSLAAVVSLSTPTLALAVPARAADMDCSDFGTQASAQAYFLSLGGPASDPDRLDSDGDGIACESNPCPCNYATTPTTPAPTPTVPLPLPPLDVDADGVPDSADACPYEHARTANGCPAPLPPPPPKRTTFGARITAVVDGDTIKVRRSGGRHYTVRLIGIDTPETKWPGVPGECGGREATSNMLRLGFTRPRDTDGDGLRDARGGNGRWVTLRTDPTQDTRDRYGRLLAYVTSATKGNLAVAQLRAGWASVYVFEDPFEQLDRFNAEQVGASAAGRGVWNMCGGTFHTRAQV